MNRDVPPRKQSIDAALVFDGDCAFCARSIAWVQRRFKQLPYITPWQDADLDRLELTARQCHEALQWVDYRGNVSGAQAVGRLLQAQGGLWRLVSWIPFVWPLSSMADALYGLVARNRDRLPGTSAVCETQPAPEPDPRELDEGQSDSA